MKQYLKYLSPPQTKPIPGKNMVKNNAGGYSFEISDIERLKRFLLLGTDGGTYYVSEEKLTADNASFVIDFIKRDSEKVFDTLKEIADAGRAPKYNTILFVFALLLTFGDKATLKRAYPALAQLCYTPSQLFSLLTFLKPLRGWSRGLRTAVGNWYLDRDNVRLAYQLVKYRQRAGYDHKDVLRLCHVKCTDAEKNNILKYAVGKLSAPSELLPSQINCFEGLSKLPEECWKGQGLIYTLESIKVNRLTWEMIPTERLNNPEVLTALVDEMPPTALMRNLNRFAYTGLTNGQNDLVMKICDKLKDVEKLKLNKVHPVNVITSLMTYKQGHGDKGNKTWEVNQHILDALHDCYKLAMQTIEPTGKHILVGVDISGSMTTEVSGMKMSCAQLGMILAHTMLITEPRVDAICFDSLPSPYPFGKRHSLDTILNETPSGGSTDCAIPLGWAIQQNLPVDAIVILTDNETWAGKSHSAKVLEVLRRTRPNVKIIEIAMIAGCYSSFENNDPNILRIVGFDATVLTLMQEFIGRV
jgi:60 kDa SS-A/Ro ribonucleoprotein